MTQQSEKGTGFQIRVKDAPFVAENIVAVEILEITPAQTEERLGFLING